MVQAVFWKNIIYYNKYSMVYIYAIGVLGNYVVFSGFVFVPLYQMMFISILTFLGDFIMFLICFLVRGLVLGWY